MPEIAEWLQLGFGQYAQRFAENDSSLAEHWGADLF
jgi:hypothetical protein